jgi:type III restriction enzyme
MLREGFDVNNICVIVPLRSSQADILLEQIIGRGLRLMWREADYQEVKDENRNLLLKQKREPSNWFDILSIVEHPRFRQFYDDLINEDLVGEVGEISSGNVLGDLVEIELKADYKNYDLFFPVIVRDKEEALTDSVILANELEPFSGFSFQQLKSFTSQINDSFVSEELTVGTQFGRYRVSAGVFNAQSYNEWLGHLIQALSFSQERIGHKKAEFPFMQINQAKLAETLDEYVHHFLFKDNPHFDPFSDENWKILILRTIGITEHIVKEASRIIYKMQQNVEIHEAEVQKYWFSEVPRIKVRDNYCVNIAKSIFERLPYPSNKGGLEKEFLQFLDNDSETECFIKVKENVHVFCYINYLRSDGLLARYFPDFIVKLADKIYIVETKAEKDIGNENVLAKKRSAVEWVRKTNELQSEDRMSCVWQYVLLSDGLFYQFRDNNASVREMLDFASIKMDTTLTEDLFELF